MDRFLRSIAIRLMEGILLLRRKGDLFGFWAYEMTPYPVGRPTWKQIRIGLLMSIGITGPANRYIEWTEKETKRILKEAEQRDARKREIIKSSKP